jgi:oxygen-independent coproporphyrinogen-3 oxidase
MSSRRGVYLHLPFCLSKCDYCDFASLPLPSPGWLDRYARALLREIAARVQGKVDTVYFGGGTPSLFLPHQLQAFLKAIAQHALLSPQAEITLEVNPATADRARLQAWKRMGINRLSLGVQSTRNQDLIQLGRRHSVEDAQVLLEEARSVGFENISCDLIYGLPGQTPEAFAAALQSLLAWKPEHISLYGLTVEPGTRLARRVEAGELTVPDDDVQADMYVLAQDMLPGRGFLQYELSNFSLPGRACRHNRIYWEYQPYLGLGASAHSFVRGRRSWNLAEPAAYCEALEKGASAEAGFEKLSQEKKQGERLILALRQSAGIRKQVFFQASTGGERFKLAFEASRKQGLIEETATHYRLTPRGMLLSNLVFRELV